MAWNKRQERERQVKAGRERESATMQGIRCIVKVCHRTSTLTTTEDANMPRVSIFPLWTTFTAAWHRLYQRWSLMHASLGSEFGTLFEMNREMWDEIEKAQKRLLGYIHLAVLGFWFCFPSRVCCQLQANWANHVVPFSYSLFRANYAD